MLYFIVLIASALGIVLIISLRVMVQSRRLRSVVSAIQQGTQALEERMAHGGAAKPTPRPRGVLLRKIDGWLREARLALTKKNGEEEAECLLIQALTFDPHSEEVTEELADLYIKTGRDTKAEVLLRELVALKPSSAFYALLGSVCERQRKYPEAVEAYERALERDPHSHRIQITLARVLLSAGRVSEAIPLLERNAVREMHDPELLFLLAECYETLQNRKAARAVYEKLARLQPHNFTVKEKLAEYALLV